MKEIPTFETERLVLRPFELHDAAEVQRLAGDRAIADTTLNIPHPYKDGMAEEWISKHRDAFAKGQGVTFAVTRKPDGSLVGAISLMGIAKGHQAGQAVLGYAFTELALLRVHASHFTRNPASGRVMQKLAMRHEGTRRRHVRRWDKCEDLELCGILKEEWEEAVN